ncbi:MAG: ComF family protein [Candidatus Sungbacteria bacterium]|nr:ComF family protein [Candidatus Sungbacteria bacterium]
MLNSVLDFCFDILFPKYCAGCHAEGSFLCDKCRKNIVAVGSICFVCERRSPQGLICENCKSLTRLRRFVSPLFYRDPIVRELIRLYKYEGVKEIGEILAGYIIEAAMLYAVPLLADALLVPIPLHKKRLRERGFNQAELMAKKLGRAWGLKIATDILMRTEYRKPQTEIKRREERLENAKGIYKINKSPPPGKIMILVDDVATTGATLEEAARVLKNAGAKQVWAFTAAR